MATAFYFTHPEVTVDPAVPVPDWQLSARGRERARRAAAAGWANGVRHIIASGERKATETAAIFGEHLGLPFASDPAFNENDRSATGFLPPPAFEAMADAFFARPAESVRGWERAVDAQERIVAAVERGLADPGPGDVLFVGHGGVGTLLLCHVAALGIARSHDQPAGGGNLFAFEIGSRRLLFGWRRGED